MIIINDLNESRFTLNGVQYFKNYLTRVAGNSLSIYNAYNTSDVLVPFSAYEKFQVNGGIFEAVEGLQAALVGICYTRNTLNEGSPADQNNIGRVISFGELLPQNGLYITREEASAKINSLTEPITISAKDTPVNFTFTREGKMYGFEFLGGKGIWGSTSGSEVFPHQFLLKTLYDITPEDITGETSGATIISLGEVPDGNFLAAANSAQRDFSNSGMADEDGTIRSYYFTYTSDGILNFVQFVGEAGIYNGNITQNDLVSSTNSKASPIIDYESVLQYGKVAVSPAKHQDRLTGMITEFNGSGFKSIKNEAAQTFKIAEPTGSHEVVFPPANQNDSIVYASQLQNEVNNYLPLTGTVDGNPITGNIEVEESISIFHDNGFYTSGILVEDGGVNLYGNDINGISCYLRFNQGGNGIKFSSNSTTSRGIIGQQDFTRNITQLDYTQKKYVDELVSTTIPLAGTETGNPVTGDIVIDATNTIGLKAGAGGEITFDNTEGIAIESNTGIKINSESGIIKISAASTIVQNSPVNYNEDLSASYTERSLVDKAYVDNLITSGTGFGYWNNTEVLWLTGTAEQMLAADGTLADIGDKVRAQQVGENTGTDTNITTSSSLQSAIWSLQEQLNTAKTYVEELKNKTTQILVNKTYNSIQLTGNTSETILASVLLEEGMLQEGVLQIAALFEKTGSAGNVYHRLYVNATDSLTGATRIASLNSTSNARPFTALSRDFLLRDNTIYGFPELTSSFDGITDTVGTPLSAPLNISQNIYIIFTGILQSADDTLSQKSLKITFEKFTD
jgi:hypothetical protein